VFCLRMVCVVSVDGGWLFNDTVLLIIIIL
jgi:hypothetical protein